MTKAELLDVLWACDEMGDYEKAHILATRALLDFIDDEEVTAAFDPRNKWWYA